MFCHIYVMEQDCSYGLNVCLYICRHCRSNSGLISYDDFVAFAEDTSQSSVIRHISTFLAILDIDNDGNVGFLDFIHFAERLKEHAVEQGKGEV